MSTWLLIDTPNLAWRAFYSTGGIRHEDRPVGVLYGILQEALHLHQRFAPDGVAWCFDSDTSLREELHPWYKLNRRKEHAHPEHRRREDEVKDQIKELRESVLPRLGYANVFGAEGYEADDVIASCCRQVCGMSPPVTTPRGVIVSNDKDLYQCLRQGTIDQYLPHKRCLVREGDLVNEYGVGPGDWAKVKAIAGCKTDGVPGVFGVGEMTAARYLSGKLGGRSKTRQAIKAAREEWEANLALTTLPWPGCPEFVFRMNRLSADKWADVLHQYGMERLLDRLPAEEGAGG